VLEEVRLTTGSKLDILSYSTKNEKTIVGDVESSTFVMVEE
jgi:hypothetical protein